MAAEGGEPEPTRIWIDGREFDVPAGATLLEAFQFLSVREVTAAGFCWKAECCSCEVDIDAGGAVDTVLSCETRVRPGMRVVGMSPTVKHSLRALLRSGVQPVGARGSDD